MSLNQVRHGWSLRQHGLSSVARRSLGASAAVVLSVVALTLGGHAAVGAEKLPSEPIPIGPPLNISASTIYVASAWSGVVLSMPPGGTAEVVAGGLRGTGPLALADDTLYTTYHGAPAGVSGSTGNVVAIPTTKQYSSVAWPDSNQDGGADVVVTGLKNPSGVAVAGNTLYITDQDYQGDGTVMSVPRTGGTPTLLASGLENPSGVAVAGNTLYITNLGPPGEVGYKPQGGSVVSVPRTGGTPTVLASGLDQPNGVAVIGSTLYITNRGGLDRDGMVQEWDGSVVSIPTTGGAPTVVASGLDFPVGVVAVDGDNLYVVTGGDRGERTVVSIPTTGGAPTVVASGLNGAEGIAVAPETVPCTGSLCNLFGS